MSSRKVLHKEPTRVLPFAPPPVQPVGAIKRHSIFLVEDHPITRAGLSALISREPDLFMCGEADNAPTALTMIARLQPSLVVADITLRTSNGIELMKNLSAIGPDLRILALSMHDEVVYAERAIRAGARGYLMKQEATEKIVPAIRVLLSGEIYLSDAVKIRLVANLASGRKAGQTTFPMETLSDREMEVFNLIGNGFATREIAGRLHLSTKTIDTYREHLKIKLSLKSGAELVRQAILWSRSENAGFVEARNGVA
ncbi:MAG: response regulator transcription factor [Opitutaceae bacterium]